MNADTGTTAQLSLQAYLEELLASPAAAPVYHLLRAGGMKVALPAACVAGEESVETSAPGGRRWLELGSVLRGAPATVAAPGVAVPLVDTPAWGLSVEACEARVEVADEAVTWRDPQGSRRWLVGLIEAPAAVIIDPVALIEEAEKHGIQGAV